MNNVVVGNLVRFTPGRYRSSLNERIGIVLEIEKNFYRPRSANPMDRLKILWFYDDHDTVTTWEPASALIKLETENVVAGS
jgi:hypothetical protein